MGLSRKSTEQQTLRYLAMQHAGVDETAPKSTSTNRISVRARLANEAHPPTDDLWQRKNYKFGDGDPNTYCGRPNAFAHLKYKSKGLLT